MKIRKFHFSKLSVAFYTECSDVSIWIHPVTMNPNLTVYFSFLSIIVQYFMIFFIYSSNLCKKKKKNGSI